MYQEQSEVPIGVAALRQLVYIVVFSTSANRDRFVVETGLRVQLDGSTLIIITTGH